MWLKISKYVLAVIVIIYGLYGLINMDFKFNTQMDIFLGLLLLVIGVEEFSKERKMTGWLFIIVFLAFVSLSI
ncbi:DUF3953 domain-containing protein [Thalassobacillus sp. CUG 92003]|uniref:DUF3953 domain-containing protein n=1 Tax=Thalassobacillus sp. CUG 92003 TaxID=2736641 RepID=UPI0015E7CC31